MFADKAHKQFLDEGWVWDGVEYTISYHSVNHTALHLVLRPTRDPHRAINSLRISEWTLLAVVGDIRVHTATFSDLMEAGRKIMKARK